MSDGKDRVKPGAMSTVIGFWAQPKVNETTPVEGDQPPVAAEGTATEQGLATFNVLVGPKVGMTDKDIKAELVKLGPGEYTVMTYRSRQVSCQKQEVTRFVM